MQEGSCLRRTVTKLEGFDLKERRMVGEVSKAEWTIIKSSIFFSPPACNRSHYGVLGRRVTDQIFGLNPERR